LLTGEPGEVNPLDSIFRGGSAQEKSCYRAKCGKAFHGDVPHAWLLRTPDGVHRPEILIEAVFVLRAAHHDAIFARRAARLDVPTPP
jgi:hypothetical protein